MEKTSAINTAQKVKTEVKLEDLLKFKREEKPSMEFWDGFEKELKQKTLQSLVKKDSGKSIYQKITWIFSGSLAATAAFYLSFITLFTTTTTTSQSVKDAIEQPEMASTAQNELEILKVAETQKEQPLPKTIPSLPKPHYVFDSFPSEEINRNNERYKKIHVHAVSALTSESKGKEYQINSIRENGARFYLAKAPSFNHF